jgi:hypothetical protein
MGELVSLCARRARDEAHKRAEEEAAEIAAELAERDEIQRMLKLLRGITESFSQELQRPYRLTLEEMDQYAPEFTVGEWYYNVGPKDGYDPEDI